MPSRNFQGSTDEITLTSSSSLMNSATASIGGWFKVAANSTYCRIYSEYIDFDQEMFIRLENTGFFTWFWRTASGIVNIAGSTAYDDGNWHWFWCQRSASNSFQCWVDGTSQGTSTSNPGTDAASYAVIIGNAIEAGIDEPLLGLLANFITFKSSIGIDDGKAILLGRLHNANPFSWYPLGLASPEPDWGTGLINGTVVGATISEEGPPILTYSPETQPETRHIAGAQFARPDADVSAGSWTTDGGSGSNLYATMDEVTALDTDYARSASAPSSDTLEVSLSDVNDPATAFDHIARYRYSKIGGTKPINLTTSLRQTSTEIAAWTHNNIGASWALAEQLLTGAQANSISDYTALRLRFVATQGTPPSLVVVASAKNNVAANAQVDGVSVTHGFTLQNGDVLYAFLGAGDDPGTAWTSSGWTQLANQASATGNDRAAGVMRKVITNAAGEPASYNFKRDNNAVINLAAIVVQVFGADVSGTPEDATTTANLGSNDYTPANVTIVTATTDALLLVAHLASGLDGTLAGKTAGAPSGYTLVNDEKYTAGTSVSELHLEVAKLENSGAPGTKTPGSWTGTPDDGVQEYVTFAVAVKPIVYTDARAAVSWAMFETPVQAGLFTQIIAGTLTSAGLLVKQANKFAIATLASAGLLQKQESKLLAGTLTDSGVLSKGISTLYAGTLTTAGALVQQTNKVTAGVFTGAGTLVNQAGKTLAGTITSTGALVKQTATSFSGALASSGVLTGSKIILLALAGTLASTGALVKQTSTTIAGILTSSGTAVKQTGKTLTAGLTSSGVVVGTKVALLALAGTLTATGALLRETQKSFAGTVTSAGALVKETAKALDAALASSGLTSAAKVALMSLAGTLTAAGALTKQSAKAFAGTLTSAGTQSRAVYKALTAALASSGALATTKTALLILSGTLTMAGDLAKQTRAMVTGALTSTGTLAKQTGKAFSGVLASIGALITQLVGFIFTPTLEPPQILIVSIATIQVEAAETPMDYLLYEPIMLDIYTLPVQMDAALEVMAA